MASSFNRKSSSSASSASKPTFRRAGASSSRPAQAARPKKAARSGAAPAKKKAPARKAPAPAAPARGGSLLGGTGKAKAASPRKSSLSAPAAKSGSPKPQAPKTRVQTKGAAPTVRRPAGKPAGGKRPAGPGTKRILSTPPSKGAASGGKGFALPALPHIPLPKLPALPGRFIGIALAAVLALGVLGIVVANSPLFAITDVVVNGSEHVTQEAAEQLVDVPQGSTLMNVDVGSIEESLGQNPWIAGADVERRFPHTLVVTPREHEVAAIAFIASSDVAWSISAEGTWIAPISLSVTVDAEGNVAPASALARADAGTPTSTDEQDAAGDAADGDAAAEDGGAGEPSDGGSDTSDEGGAASGGDADAAGDAGDGEAADAAQQAPAVAVPEGSQLLTGVDAAVALAQQDGVVLFTDVAADIEPSSGAEVTSEVLLAGLEYVNGFSSSFRSEVRELSLESVEAISAILKSGIEVSLGEPVDIATKERIVTRLLEQEQGVVYINVSTPDHYTFRQAQSD